jgi:hypothetical protein
MKYYKLLMVGLLLISFSGCLSNNESSDSSSGGPSSTPSYGLEWTSAVSAGLVNSCIGPFSLALTDGNGNITLASADTEVYLSTSSNDAITYQDSACLQENSSVTIAQNSSSASFYLKDDLVETMEIDAESGDADIELPLATTAESATGDYLVGTNGSGGVATCSGPVTFSVDHQGGVATTAPADVSILLNATDNTVEFYSDSACSQSTSNVTMIEGASSVSVYYIGYDLGTFTIQASSSLGSANSSVSMSSGAVANIVMAGEAGSVGSCLPVVVTYSDIYENATSLTSSMSVSLELDTSSSAGYAAYTDAACTIQIAGTYGDSGFMETDQLTLPVGSSFTFYVQENVSDEMSVEINPNSGYVDSGSTTITFQ